MQQYTYRQRQKKLRRERQWYEANHSEIVEQFAGKYIGVHNEQVVDSDSDGPTLSKRLRENYGRVSIAIIQVEEAPALPTLHMRSPKLSIIL